MFKCCGGKPDPDVEGRGRKAINAAQPAVVSRGQAEAPPLPGNSPNRATVLTPDQKAARCAPKTP